MEITKIPYDQTNSFSKHLIDYLTNDKKLKPFVNHFPSIDAFKQQIIEKQKHTINRSVLVKVLKKQNASVELSDKTEANIDSLLLEETFTVTTGHQLCLFTGPLYFLYKIISTINLAEQLKEKYPAKNIVPIYWMATEDHDYEEVNHAYIFGKKRSWNSEQSGAVGRMKLDNIDNLLNELRSILGESDDAMQLMQLFKKAYLEHQNLADATRFLVNDIFGQYGLVIIDGDDKKLKEQFIPLIKKDVLTKGFADAIRKCTEQLAKDYKAQAYVRDVNFFYLSNGSRGLIKDGVSVADIEESPETFSPNVLMRPLYQESVLPNVAYIGGGAELAYWMQLKTAFEQEEMPFPIFLLRNSALLVSEQQTQKWESLGFEITDLFSSQDELKKKYILSKKSFKLSLQTEKEELLKTYAKILKKTTDDGLQKSVRANLQKQLKSLEKLEQKLLRLEKKKHESTLNQIEKIKAQLFPNNSLQERHDNFIPFYLQYGDNFIEILKKSLNPLDANFVVLSHLIK
tara:strand:+ start:927 stop:2468 length:1542 start_codon:yes stop_codon:yes gene_type:complete